MGKPHLIVFVGLEFVFKTKGKVGLNAFPCPIIVVEKRIIVHIRSDPNSITSAAALGVPWNLILNVCNVISASKPSSAICLKLSF